MKILRVILIVLFLWLILGMITAAVFFRYFGDLRPALLPVSSSQTNQQNSSNLNATKSSLPTADPLQMPNDFQIGILTDQVPGARDLQITPGGNLLVSSPNKGKIFGLRLSDTQPQVQEVLASLSLPHGIAFYQGKLFVAESSQVNRYRWDEQNLKATFEKKMLDLPNGSVGLHHTRSLVFDSAGKLYVSIGSTCNVCQEKNAWNAAVIVTDQDGNNPQIFAPGLRNAVFLALNPDTDQVWVTDMGRDNLGDTVPPDEINILRANTHYGWPYCYGNKIYDQNYGQESANYCQNTTSPIFEIPAHSAPLGLAFIQSAQFPQDWQGDLLVAYHGSWNRSVPDGYKVVRIQREGDRLVAAEDFISGFLVGQQSYGRPVDVIFDPDGNLYVSDDKAGRIYQVNKKP